MIGILISDENHPTYKLFRGLGFDISTRLEGLPGGEILFLVSCTEMVDTDKYDRVFVIHESDVPSGRGWSPLAWQILEGKNSITYTLMEASHPVDSGRIIKQYKLELEGHELYDEIHYKSFQVKKWLIEYAIDNELTYTEQQGEPDYYRRRIPEDSRLDPHKSIAGQFDLLRICDPRFHAFFDYRGHRYKLTICKQCE